MVAIWVPIMGMITFFGTVIAVFYLHYAGKVKKYDTVVKLAECGGQVNPEMIAMLGQESGPTGDLRKGLVWLAIGIPLVIGLLTSGGAAGAGFGLIPIFIGVAYLIIYRIGYKDRPAVPGTSSL